MDDVLTWERLAETWTVRAERLDQGRLGFYAPQPPRVIRAVPYGVHRGRKASLTAGAIVGTRTAWWDPCRYRLRAQPVPFVLVSLFHDSVITQRAVDEVRTPDSAVRAWFGVQVGTPDPRVVPMPIGAKTATVAAMVGVPRRPRLERDVLLYVNFARRNAEREALWEAFPWATRDPWDQHGVPRYVERLGRAQFVLSPPGRGWDCYRTYEALSMGAIPIVKACPPFDRVVAGLPVLVVRDWHEVTPERLRRDAARFPEAVPVLTQPWRDRICAAQQECIDEYRQSDRHRHNRDAREGEGEGLAEG